MKLTSDMEIVDGLPILHIRSLSAIVCSDLHLGYEGVMADRGTFLPKANLKNIKNAITDAAKKTKATRIIIDGDIKNEFSEVHIEEYNEFYELVHLLKDELKFKQIDLVKGNHDNFIDRLEKPFNIKLYRQEAKFDDYLFFHGEEMPRTTECKTMVMGHLHPSIGVYSNLGVKEKLRCFLYGKTKGKADMIILPAMNFFSEGAEVNAPEMRKESDVLEQLVDLREMNAISIEEGETLDFGKVKDLIKAR